MKRIKNIRLKNNEDIICNIMLCRADLTGSILSGLFGRSVVVDPISGAECIVVSNPVKVINQFNLNNGEVMVFLVPWMSQTDSNIFMIPYDHIANVSDISPETEEQYALILEKLEHSETATPMSKTKESKEKGLKFVSPPHPETH